MNMWEPLLYLLMTGLFFWAVVAIFPAAYRGFRAFRQGHTLKGVLGMGYAILATVGLTALWVFELKPDLLGLFVCSAIGGVFAAGLACSGMAVWCICKGRKKAALLALVIFLVTVGGFGWWAWQWEQETVVSSHAEDFAGAATDRELLALLETERSAVYIYRVDGKVMILPYTAVRGGWRAWETEYLPSVYVGERMVQVTRMKGTEDVMLTLVRVNSPDANSFALPTTAEPWTITDSLGNTAAAAEDLRNGTWKYCMLVTAPDETYTLNIGGVTVPLGTMTKWQ